LNVTSLGIDLGSVKCGCVALDGRIVVGAATIDVEEKRLDPTVAAIFRAYDVAGASEIIAEWAERPYVPRDATPQTAAAIMRARETMAVLLDRIEREAATRSIPVARIAAVSWRAKIVRATRRRGTEGFRESSWRRLNPRRDTADHRVKIALRHLLGDDVDALRDVHQRDAAGAVLGALMLREPGETRSPRTRSTCGHRTPRIKQPKTKAQILGITESQRQLLEWIAERGADGRDIGSTDHRGAKALMAAGLLRFLGGRRYAATVVT
jgi:hypothetical protein